MSLLVSWIGIDTHGPASAYIAGESRFTWGNIAEFDYGKKVFASHLYPEVFGYAGDVLFPSVVLTQIVEMINTDILFNKDMSCDCKNKIVLEKLCHAFSNYPTAQSLGVIEILHISRDTLFEAYPNFHCYFMSWRKATGWKVEREKKKIPETSNIVAVLGSGKSEFMNNYDSKYKLGPNSSTSRNVFHCFIDTLFSMEERTCGGPPQLVGIYRKPNSFAKNFGIIYRDKRYFLGAEVPKNSCFDKIEWRNEFFERCDGNTKKIMKSAMKQPDLLRRK